MRDGPLALCPRCEAPALLDLMPAVVQAFGTMPYEATLRPDLIVERCATCGRIGRHHHVIPEEEIDA